MLLPVAAYATATLSDITEVLINNADFLSKLFWAACIVVGVSLLSSAFTQFQIHRFNPKQVPLSTPVIYLILGVCAIAVPFAERIFKVEDSNYLESQIYERPSTDISILPPPVEREERKK